MGTYLVKLKAVCLYSQIYVWTVGNLIPGKCHVAPFSFIFSRINTFYPWTRASGKCKKQQIL